MYVKTVQAQGKIFPYIENLMGKCLRMFLFHKVSYTKEEQNLFSEIQKNL